MGQAPQDLSHRHCNRGGRCLILSHIIGESHVRDRRATLSGCTCHLSARLPDVSRHDAWPVLDESNEVPAAEIRHADQGRTVLHPGDLG
jgi:hypothetical protein